jgi:hypothetical protein
VTEGERETGREGGKEIRKEDFQGRFMSQPEESPFSPPPLLSSL